MNIRKQILAATALLFFFAGCNAIKSHQRSATKQLVGKWALYNPDTNASLSSFIEIWEFGKDMTFKKRYEGEADGLRPFSGTWEWQDEKDALKISVAKSAMTMKGKILQLDENKLIMRVEWDAPDGSARLVQNFKRMR